MVHMGSVAKTAQTHTLGKSPLVFTMVGVAGRNLALRDLPKWTSGFREIRFKQEVDKFDRPTNRFLLSPVQIKELLNLLKPETKGSFYLYPTRSLQGWMSIDKFINRVREEHEPTKKGFGIGILIGTHTNREGVNGGVLKIALIEDFYLLEFRFKIKGGNIVLSRY